MNPIFTGVPVAGLGEPSTLAAALVVVGWAVVFECPAGVDADDELLLLLEHAEATNARAATATRKRARTRRAP
jgi:hypothetical protein